MPSATDDAAACLQYEVAPLLIIEVSREVRTRALSCNNGCRSWGGTSIFNPDSSVRRLDMSSCMDSVFNCSCALLSSTTNLGTPGQRDRSANDGRHILLDLGELALQVFKRRACIKRQERHQKGPKGMRNGPPTCQEVPSQARFDFPRGRQPGGCIAARYSVLARHRTSSSIRAVQKTDHADAHVQNAPRFRAVVGLVFFQGCETRR